MNTVKSEWGMACPKCHRDDQINITALIFVRLTPDGTDVDGVGVGNGDHEWDDNSPALCEFCGFAGTVKEFNL